MTAAGPLSGLTRSWKTRGVADRDSMTGDELDDLAEALFWQDRQAESLEAWRDAYRAHLAAGELERATHAVWRIFCEHFLLGETTVAGGWLERGRGHAREVPGSAAEGFIVIASSMWAGASGDLESAVAEARRARSVGENAADRDVAALARATEGRGLVDLGRADEGMAALDEAMVSVINGELAPLYTGWIYCTMLGACHDLADLRRAGDWTEAALQWCDSLDAGRLYLGLCRTYRVEIDLLRGAWETAEAGARRACDDLTAHDPRYAGEAFYLAGEVARVKGDLERAQEAFTRAHELGRLPQPGLALVRLAQNRAADAVKALRSALQPGPPAPLPRAQLLAAAVEAETRVGEDEAARAAADELGVLAEASDSPMISAMAAAADGVVRLTEGDRVGSTARFREACRTFTDLGLTHAAAETQVRIGIAARDDGDDDTATLELTAALAAFERLGAKPDVERTRELLERKPAPSTTLTEREIEVLRLVAEGHTNREVAEALVVSRHTVARHLSNIFTKIGVNSRAAATAYAYEHQLVRRLGGQP